VTDFRLDGRTALVTGSGRGIGAAAARGLAAAGAEVIVMSRSRQELDAMVAEIEAAGGRAQARVCDVCDSAALKTTIGGLARLDILVNNAGFNIPEPFVEVSADHLDKLLDLNVRAAFLAAQFAVQKMLEAPDRKQRGGAVIHISSQMGHVGSPRRTVYCMTKHALEGLNKAMAVELAPHNIRVNAVGPTFVETPLTQTFFANAQFRDWVVERIPMGRIGRMEEVVGAIVFLASPAASLITGASLLVDGGWTAQ
jgi:NAD(P)-dependent dehydrogenase (short-subunit alcohol dehydrogenase family)